MVLGLAVVLGVSVELRVCLSRRVSLSLHEAVIGVFELDRWVDSIWTGTEVGIHMGGHVSLELIQRALYVTIIFVSLVNSVTEGNHMLVVGPESENADNCA